MLKKAETKSLETTLYRRPAHLLMKQEACIILYVFGELAVHISVFEHHPRYQMNISKAQEAGGHRQYRNETANYHLAGILLL